MTRKQKISLSFKKAMYHIVSSWEQFDKLSALGREVEEQDAHAMASSFKSPREALSISLEQIGLFLGMDLSEMAPVPTLCVPVDPVSRGIYTPNRDVADNLLIESDRQLISGLVGQVAARMSRNSERVPIVSLSLRDESPF